MYEKDADDDYITSRYNLSTHFRNVGGKGGLSLVTDHFFDWGMKAMRLVAKELTVKDIEMKGAKAIKAAKNGILQHPTLKSNFILICHRALKMDDTLVISPTLSSKVFDAITTC